MDQDALVNAAKVLIDGLDQQEIKVRAAMWVHRSENDSWRLWIVVPEKIEKKPFYQAVASLQSSIEEKFPDFTLSDVEMRSDTDPVIKALAVMIRAEGFATVHLSRNMVNGVYTPDGILLRMAL